jgi:hypothetical protein
MFTAYSTSSARSVLAQQDTSLYASLFLVRQAVYQFLGRVKAGFCMTCSLQVIMEEAHGQRKHAFTPYQISNKLQCR